MEHTTERHADLHPVVLWARYAYLFVAWLFVLWVIIQFFLIGLSFFTTLGFEPHIEFGHTFGIVLVLLVLAALVARLPLRMIGLTVLLFILYGLQYVFANVALGNPGLGWVFAFHPVNALAMFWVGLLVARRARRFLPGPLGSMPRAEPTAAQVPTSS